MKLIGNWPASGVHTMRLSVNMGYALSGDFLTYAYDYHNDNLSAALRTLWAKTMSLGSDMLYSHYLTDGVGGGAGSRFTVSVPCAMANKILALCEEHNIERADMLRCLTNLGICAIDDKH